MELLAEFWQLKLLLAALGADRKICGLCDWSKIQFKRYDWLIKTVDASSRLDEIALILEASPFCKKRGEERSLLGSRLSRCVPEPPEASDPRAGVSSASRASHRPAGRFPWVSEPSKSPRCWSPTC